MRYWNGYSWRRISDVEARLRRARGEEVLDTKEPLDAPPPAATPPPVKPPDDLPPASVVTMPGVVSADLAAELTNREEAAASRPAVDLTDEELERLTAPGGAAG